MKNLHTEMYEKITVKFYTPMKIEAYKYGYREFFNMYHMEWWENIIVPMGNLLATREFEKEEHD